MSSDIRMAFAHPSERAQATAQAVPLDRISVRDHIVDVEIGAFQAERGITQRVCFNIVVEVQPVTGPVDDDVDRILSYDRVTEAIAQELAEERLNLLETLAERVADRILQAPQAVRVFVRIEKLDRGPGALGVEIVRANAPTEAVSVETDAAVSPLIVFLSPAAIDSPHLGQWMDQSEARDQPLIFCVGPSGFAAPKTEHPLAQRRIDLLAIEQNAWVLAARDPRCVVVATRTELDWAIKNGQTCVWAPSKIVLDAVEGRSADPRDAVALAAWFAGLFDTPELVVVGSAPTENNSPSVRYVSADSKVL